MNYPGSAYHRRGFEEGFMVGVEYQRRVSIAATHFVRATEAGINIALSRGHIKTVPIITSEERISEIHECVFNSIQYERRKRRYEGAKRPANEL